MYEDINSRARLHPRTWFSLSCNLRLHSSYSLSVSSFVLLCIFVFSEHTSIFSSWFFLWIDISCVCYSTVVSIIYITSCLGRTSKKICNLYGSWGSPTFARLVLFLPLTGTRSSWLGTDTHTKCCHDKTTLHFNCSPAYSMFDLISIRLRSPNIVGCEDPWSVNIICETGRKYSFIDWRKRD